MKIYQYDHCPFCVRAIMVANYKQINYEPVTLLNDDEKTCFDLIGAKQVPILQFNDGHSMPESLDIAHRLDQIGAPDKVILPLADVDRLMEPVRSHNLAISCLLYPRDIAIQLPEFATPSAIAYFQNKKEKSIGRSFAEAMSQTAEHMQTVAQMLAGFPSLTLPSEQDQRISWDDVHVFPFLRNLTIVKGLAFPERVRKYIEEVAGITAVRTYFDRAI